LPRDEFLRRLARAFVPRHERAALHRNTNAVDAIQRNARLLHAILQRFERHLEQLLGIVFDMSRLGRRTAKRFLASTHCFRILVKQNGASRRRTNIN
jgi:hypothetical protein